MMLRVLLLCLEGWGQAELIEEGSGWSWLLLESSVQDRDTVGGRPERDLTSTELKTQLGLSTPAPSRASSLCLGSLACAVPGVLLSPASLSLTLSFCFIFKIKYQEVLGSSFTSLFWGCFLLLFFLTHTLSSWLFCLFLIPSACLLASLLTVVLSLLGKSCAWSLGSWASLSVS